VVVTLRTLAPSSGFVTKRLECAVHGTTGVNGRTASSSAFGGSNGAASSPFSKECTRYKALLSFTEGLETTTSGTKEDPGRDKS
jgi:hypothetical protein